MKVFGDDEQIAFASKKFEEKPDVTFHVTVKTLARLADVFEKDPRINTLQYVNGRALSVYAKSPFRNIKMILHDPDGKVSEVTLRLILSDTLDSYVNEDDCVGFIVFEKQPDFVNHAPVFNRYTNIAMPIKYLRVNKGMHVCPISNKFVCSTDPSVNARFRKNTEYGLVTEEFEDRVDSKTRGGMKAFDLFLVSYDNEDYWTKEETDDGLVYNADFSKIPDKTIEHPVVKNLVNSSDASVSTLTRILLEEYIKFPGTIDYSELIRNTIKRYETDDLPITSEERKRVIENLNEKIVVLDEKGDYDIKEIFKIWREQSSKHKEETKPEVEIKEPPKEEPHAEPGSLDDFFSALGRKI